MKQATAPVSLGPQPSLNSWGCVGSYLEDGLGRWAVDELARQTDSGLLREVHLAPVPVVRPAGGADRGDQGVDGQVSSQGAGRGTGNPSGPNGSANPNA